MGYDGPLPSVWELVQLITVWFIRFFFHPSFTSRKVTLRRAPVCPHPPDTLEGILALTVP